MAGGAPIALSRKQVLAYRAAVHQIETPEPDPARAAALTAGVRDNGSRRELRMVLRARVAPDAAPAIAPLVDGDALALAHTVRGALHVHPRGDLPLFAAAIRWREAGELAAASFGPLAGELAAAGIRFDVAVDDVAAAMRAVMADGMPRGKGVLSGAITPALDRRLAPWCEGCGVFHAQDALFRYATLQAGLSLDADLNFVVSAAPAGRGSTAGPEPDASRREIVRRFLHLCGPATKHRLAAWLAITPAAAQRLLDDQPDRVKVTVDGKPAWANAADLDALESAPPPRAARLLPPYDPLTELADRELLVPDPARRKAVWRATANPGAVVWRGEIVATARLMVCRDRLKVTVGPVRPLDRTARRAIEGEAAALAGFLGRPRADTKFDGD